MISYQRVYVPANGLAENTNLQVRHPAETGSWLWVKGEEGRLHSLTRWTIQFHLNDPSKLRFHITADQRFQCRIDDHEIAYGPDRGAPDLWNVASYELHLDAGIHEIDVLCWWLAEAGHELGSAPEFSNDSLGKTNPPMAQMSLRPGFLFVAEGEWDKTLSTGKGDWKAQILSDSLLCSPAKVPGYHVIGPEFEIDMAKWRAEEPAEITCVRPPVVPTIHGIRPPGWGLTSATLPEQARQFWHGGQIRAVRSPAEPASAWTEATTQHPELSSWQALVNQSQPLKIPPHTELEVLWDFETYLCGYPQLQISGGQESIVECAWAESLFEEPDGQSIRLESRKGHRSEIVEKSWCGIADRWISDGQANAELPTLWWRSGRYLRISVRTQDAPVTLKQLTIKTTGYPFQANHQWESDDAEWDKLIPLMENGLTVCAHETWMDCPYYEQLNYLGDTLLHALSNYTCFQDVRLSECAITHFNHSRNVNGWPAERFPSEWRQESGTYAMLFPCMLRDYLIWRGNESFVLEQLAGARSTIEKMLSIRNPNGLIGVVPGWPCTDWSVSWYECSGPGMREGDSSILNLHAVRALEAMVTIEEAIGESIQATRYQQLAKELFSTTINHYWDSSSKRLRDTNMTAAYSEHAQTLLILCQSAPAELKQQAMQSLLQDQDLARTTSYFSHYLLEAFRQEGEEAAFHNRLQWWRGLSAQGFTALPEAPEPSRSDAHAWSAHPLFHSYASIAGIRPTKPGMRHIEVCPLPGPFKKFNATCVHPRGHIRLDYRSEETETHISLSCPAEIQGHLSFHQQKAKIREGYASLCLPTPHK